MGFEPMTFFSETKNKKREHNPTSPSLSQVGCSACGSEHATSRILSEALPARYLDVYCS